MVVAGYAFHPAHHPQTPEQTPEQAIAQTLVAQTDTLSGLISGLATLAAQNASAPALQSTFLKARLAYKRIEWAVEYVNPVLARLLNGPPVPEGEQDIAPDALPGEEPPRFVVLEPEGLQVIEGLLFPAPGPRTASMEMPGSRTSLLAHLEQLRTNCQKCRFLFAHIDLLGGQVFDAGKLEVFRVITLGLTGFDAPLTLHVTEESDAALSSIQAAIAHYGVRATPAFALAIAYLRAHPDFNTFDRARFITTCANPLTRDITRLGADLHIPVIRYNRLLRQDAATLFDAGAFDADAYAPGPGYVTTTAKIALGSRLFSNPLLSGSGTRSCATCHRPDKAFADGLVHDTVLGGVTLLARNTPTLINAALQPAQFYDLRAGTLEDQVSDVLRSPLEMGGSVQRAAALLSEDTLYRTWFARVFGRPAGTPVDTLEVMNALAAYVRSLVALDSRFDAYMRGDSTALGGEEIRGFNLFMGKARCGTCHYMPLFSGVLPPRFDRMETEVIGVPATPLGAAIDPDSGRFGVVPEPFLRHAFKTTTIRNAGRTAPYMHNGVFGTLEEVMTFYNNGGGAAVVNKTLSGDSLHLTPTEVKAVIAFIRSTDSR